MTSLLCETQQCKQGLLPDTEASFLWLRNLEKLHQRNRFAIVYVGIRIISDLQTVSCRQGRHFYNSHHLFPGKFPLQHSKESFVGLTGYLRENTHGKYYSTYLPPLLVAEKNFCCRIGEIIQRLDKQRKCGFKVYTVSCQNNVWS